MYNINLNIKAYIAPRQTGKTSRAIIRWLKDPEHTTLVMIHVPFNFIIKPKLMLSHRLSKLESNSVVPNNIKFEKFSHQWNSGYAISGLDEQDGKIFDSSEVNRYFGLGNRKVEKIILDEYCFYSHQTKKTIAMFLRDFHHEIKEVVIYSTPDQLYDKNHKDNNDILFWPQTELVFVKDKWNFVNPKNQHTIEGREPMEIFGQMFKI
jgi:hypothetical protein